MPTIKFKLKDPKYCISKKGECFCCMSWNLRLACKLLSTKDNIVYLKDDRRRLDACIDKFGE